MCGGGYENSYFKGSAVTGEFEGPRVSTYTARARTDLELLVVERSVMDQFLPNQMQQQLNTAAAAAATAGAIAAGTLATAEATATASSSATAAATGTDTGAVKQQL